MIMINSGVKQVYLAEDVEEAIVQAKRAAEYYQAKPDNTDLPDLIERCIRWALAGNRESSFHNDPCCEKINGP